jgi:hypothetical protein
MRALAATLAIATVAGGCAAEQPVTATESIVPTIPLHVLARNIGDFRGRTVRTCGPELEAARRPDGEVAYWIMSARDPISRHNNIYSGVHIASCAARPPVDADGCVTGRVAREDGSLEAPADVIIGSHRIVSFEWILHPQCGPTR